MGVLLKSPNPELREFPAPESGVKLVSVAELVERCATDPAFRRAIDTMERAAGAPSEIKIAIRKQLVHDAVVARRVESQIRAINYARRKAESCRAARAV